MKCCYLSVAGFFLSALAASAQTPVPAAKEMNFLEILLKGGVMMYPLGIMSIITVLLILVFLLTIRRNAIVSDRFMNMTEAMIRKRDFLGLITLSHRRNECMARITQKTLEFMNANPGASFEDVRDVAQVEGSHQASMLTSRISYLADLGGIAPMVGLLGTVIGMIKAFLEISSGGVEQGVRQMGLAEGVSEALIATAGGLAISIPALAFYSIFRGKVQKYTSELEAAATHFIAILHTQMDRQPQYAAPGRAGREEHKKSSPSPHAGERPDIHGI
ncbi:MotA/TolQ/ExbB proton channel family protein [Luteolibacter yonseiensis]|uniref:MotA/TolQ/ExbB proton channel family protein n=1 Tax=Luteolibacter yonseiensis TaxID=1144680 RepID=A0A934R0M5_9BACT|nr:MotA/TolQ/ExbB proton channel family protein [Luteolibacter yonseiensis]MBK1814557.1 MotA/TolQ/ExbB proton channel family protein [Luteolibacter yonseiensis]